MFSSFFCFFFLGLLYLKNRHLWLKSRSASCSFSDFAFKKALSNSPRPKIFSFFFAQNTFLLTPKRDEDCAVEKDIIIIIQTLLLLLLSLEETTDAFTTKRFKSAKEYRKQQRRRKEDDDQNVHFY